MLGNLSSIQNALGLIFNITKDMYSRSLGMARYPLIYFNSSC